MYFKGKEERCVADPDFYQCSVFQSTDKLSSDISVLMQCSYSSLTVLIQFTSRQAKVQPKLGYQYVNFMLLVHLNLYVWKIRSYYEFGRECKFIQYWKKHNQPPNLRLKAEVRSTPLIL